MNYRFTIVDNALAKRVRIDAHTSGIGSAVYDVGSGTGDRFRNIWAQTFNGEATSATYADIAEKYTTNETDIPVGTLIELSESDEYDCQVCISAKSEFVIGVVSEKPAFIMNSSCDGIKIGLLGRVPVRVYGIVKKRDKIISYGDGIAVVDNDAPDSQVIGYCLESNDKLEEKLVECLIK